MQDKEENLKSKEPQAEKEYTAIPAAAGEARCGDPVVTYIPRENVNQQEK